MATTKRTVDVELSTSGLDAQGRPRRIPLATDERGNVVTIDPMTTLEPELEGPVAPELDGVAVHHDDAGVLGEGRRPPVAQAEVERRSQHEDHVAVSQATTEAFYRAREGLGAGGPADEAGAPLQRLFYAAVTETDLARMYESMRAAGQEVDPDAPFMPRAVPDHTITVRVDTSSVADGKYAALSEHATQSDEIQAFTEVDRDLMLATLSRIASTHRHPALQAEQ